MKSIFYPLFFLLLAFSCTPNDEFSLEQDPDAHRASTLIPSQAIGQWKLVKVKWRSQIAGQPDATYPLSYEEVLHLNPDSSVTRYRNGVKATGSFSIKTYPNSTDWHVVVKLDDPTVAFHTIGNYTLGLTQGMALWNGEGKYLMIDASASDGPTVYYQKLPSDEKQ